jgi:AhpD family alkylhydroperoxidase
MVLRPATPGFVKVLLYRHTFFGKPVGRYGQAVLCGPIRWLVAERKLFGALVSVENQCGYCAGVHGENAGVALGADVVGDVVHGRDGPRVAAMVPFLCRLSQGPDRIATGDVVKLRSAGLDDEEILDAVHAAVLLEICNRVVNALGVEPMDPAQNRRAARFLLRHGYDL